MIGGEQRGRRLRSPRGAIRPTAAILRRSLFDILGPRVLDARVLDLYAGAGTLGIEALSRGAVFCDFVDRDRACANVIAENLALVDMGERGRAHCAPVLPWLQRNQAGLEDYDLVFVDPPYGDSTLIPTLSLLAMPPNLGDEALVVVETESRRELDLPTGLALRRHVVHGDSALHMLASAP